MTTKHPTLHTLLIALLAAISFIATGWSASKWLGKKKPERIDYLITYLTSSNTTSFTYREIIVWRPVEIRTIDDLNGVREFIWKEHGLSTNAGISFLLIKRFPL